jgi:putative transposase
MYLSERHIIRKNHEYFDECDILSFQSKNIYNYGLFLVKQHFFETKKYLNYNALYHEIKNHESYNYLPTKVSCQTLKLIDQNFKSFFGALKKIKEDKKVRIPKYLDKIKGRFMVKFPKQALSLKEFKATGRIALSKSNIKIVTKVKDFDKIKEVRIVNKNDYYVIEVILKTESVTIKKDNNRYAGVDLGIGNLATVSSNCKGFVPFIINGKPLKSINQYYNKEKGRLQSELEKKQKKKKSKKITKLTNKRGFKVRDYLHKASRLLVNHLVSNDITKVVIGKNINWKQDINIGKVNNQNFVQIPFNDFVNMIKYKCELLGIEVITREESYTSKCSFFDGEEIKKHETYLGKRIKRGLFRTKNGNLINSDLNGSYNILKKEFPRAFADGIEGLGVNPVKFNI